MAVKVRVQVRPELTSQGEKPISQAHCTTSLRGSQYYSWYNTEQITEWPFAQISFENFSHGLLLGTPVTRRSDGTGHIQGPSQKRHRMESNTESWLGCVYRCPLYSKEGVTIHWNCTKAGQQGVGHPPDFLLTH